MQQLHFLLVSKFSRNAYTEHLKAGINQAEITMMIRYLSFLPHKLCGCMTVIISPCQRLPAECHDVLARVFISTNVSVKLLMTIFKRFSHSEIKLYAPFLACCTATYSNAAGSVTSVDHLYCHQKNVECTKVTK